MITLNLRGKRSMITLKDEEAQLGTADFTKNNIKGALLNLLVAGIDTTAINLNWAMAELVRNPRVLEKEQLEIRNRVGNKGKPKVVLASFNT
ncbi:Cytochrome P450 71B10 [Euphorbia peplus]|nr:Cytochrome P450 71B10 [Euphorbia peplus]